VACYPALRELLLAFQAGMRPTPEAGSGRGLAGERAAIPAIGYQGIQPGFTRCQLAGRERYNHGLTLDVAGRDVPASGKDY
jgi:hypothetical protein